MTRERGTSDDLYFVDLDAMPAEALRQTLYDGNLVVLTRLGRSQSTSWSTRATS